MRGSCPPTFYNRLVSEGREPFRRTLQVRWSDIDFLAHMKNTAYLDAAVDVRFLYFESRGLKARDFTSLGIGPVVQRDQVEYFRELRFLEPYTVTHELAGASEDYSRFMLRNEFFRPDGKLAARLTSTGGWLDLAKRQLIAPPPVVAAALAELTRTADWAELPTSVRAGRAGE
jgi:acyl-CoA thioester hydrolase